MKARELVTVVIPAHDEEQFLDACLASVRAQTHSDLQILVVDGASTDGTADIVRAHMAEDDRVELLHNDRLNIPSSLNLALRRARGTWLVRVDAHATIPKDYVDTAVALLREGCWGGVGGRKDGVGRTPAGRAIAVAMSSRLAVGNSTYHFGTEPQEVDHLAFGAYPVAVAREIHGWDERLTANEDYEFDYRIRQTGRRLLFDPAMVIDWHCRQALRDLFRQYRRYGSGKVDVALLHPDSLSPRHVAPPLFVVYLAAALLEATRHPRRALLMVAPYGAALAVETMRLAPRLDHRGEQLRVPAAVAAMHTGWGLGFWLGLGRRVRAAAPAKTGP
jgi:glycosyltransferase involved in cell wall biosynthesis